MNPQDFEEPPLRRKSRRTRIKEHRAARHRTRFYVFIDGEERARDTGVRTTRPFRCAEINLPKFYPYITFP